MKYELRSDLPDVPDRMRRLAVDSRGYPVPWFVAWLIPGKTGPEAETPRGYQHGGQPDFRVLNSTATVEAVKGNLCWLCGQVMGQYKSYVAGPMCAVNRNSAEPPCHHDCAVFAAIACPFLSRPKAKRRDANLPEHKEAPGIAILRNPGATVVWTIKGSIQLWQAPNGTLFDLGEPHNVEWFANGREATYEEVWESIETGLPTLREYAELQAGGVEALEAQVEQAKPLLPARA